MVSSSLDKKKNAAPRHKTANKNIKAQSRNKPLINYRFYLDVKNRVSAIKFEVKIKELGGVLELFLTKEVTHLITDREECQITKGGGFYPKTPQSVTNEPYNNDFSNIFETTPGRGRPKTRADAMLERARKATTVISKDLLEQARNWGITVWAVEKAIAWLDKVTLSVKVSLNKRSYKVFELKGPYIKFEAFNRETRPTFQEIRYWPSLNIFGSAGDPGIVLCSFVEHNMTRKTRSNQPRLNTALQPGYCEVCRAEYPRLNKHLESERHLRFLKDSSNFLELDTLINNTTSIDSFLKINGVDNISELTLSNHSICKTMPQTRAISLSDKIKNSPLSPTRTESRHRLRSQRQCSINSSLGTIGDDDVHLNKFEGAHETRELRSSTRQLLKLVENEKKDTWDSGRPKRTCIKQKRSSAEERLVLDNRMYYKVEVLSNKLRSSNDNTREEPIKRAQTPAPPEYKENNKDKSLIVKFKRMRSSELKQLNNEAENFLFPKKDESSSEDDLDADGPETTVSIRDGDSTVLLSSETDEPKEEEIKHLDEASLDSNWSESSIKKRKRRTHAEAFISDNQKYYKFETPGSRYHGSYLPPITNGQKSPKHNGEHAIKALKSQEKESSKKEKQNLNPVKLDLEELQFSFERVPQSEPWYQTFRRQDEGQEYYTCFSDSGYWKPFLLPYQMDSIPPLDPRCCIKAYQEVKKHLFHPNSASTSTGTNTPDSNCQDENFDDLQEECSKASEDSSILNTKPDDECIATEIEYAKQKKKRRGIVLSRNPRKSPRQHASTLAILSSLIHQRKRRNDVNRSRNLESNTSKQRLPSISEVEDDKKLASKEEVDYDRIAKSMDEVLCSLTDLDQLEISADENVAIGMSCKLSAIDILEDYDRKQRDNADNSAKRVYTTGKKPGRKKKKKNRTGWPNKNRRAKKGSEVLKEEEPDDSTLDSLSVNADSDFNEDNCDEGVDDVNGDVDNIIRDSCVKQIIDSVDQSKYSLQMNVNSSANVQTNRVATNDNLKDRVNTVHKNDNSINNMGGKDSNDRIVDLDRWENAEKVLSAKVTNSEINNDIQFQPYVRVQKLDSDVNVRKPNRRLRNSSSPHRTVKRPRRIPASPKSPRMLRKPRGRWYRER